MFSKIYNLLKMHRNWGMCHNETIKLALPILGAHLVEALLPFINTAMAASLGERFLAASALVSSTFLACMGFCWGIIASVGIITAKKIGASEKQHRIGLVFWSGLITSLIVSIPVILVFKYIQSFWLLMGQNPAIAQLGQYYFNGLLLGVFADLAKFAIFQFAIACGRPRVPLIANIVSVPLLVVCNSILVKEFGIYGIGLGTSITYWLVFIAMLMYVLKSVHFKNYLLYKNKLIDYFKICLEQLRLGVPIGLMFSIELLFFAIITLWMGHISTTTLAAYQIAMQWMWLTVMLTYGFTEAVTILVAKAHGARDANKGFQFAHSGIILAGISTCIIAMIYWIFPGALIGIDLSAKNNPDLIKFATTMLLFCGIYQILDSMRIVISGALRGNSDTKFPMWSTVFSFWVIGLPIAYTCAFLLNWQSNGLWLGLIVAAITGFLIQYHRLYHLLHPKLKTLSCKT